ncbi:hypothetical protein [Spartinivicinus poritis]|uniref:Uncharacterized protein n=1 Tax=Spartinivicinus poritis TaxID=2994640 RepID=A0ABT5UCD3_9GAMM|nr:hypothetical protein [Spartinivicinus sp. A2-2]MDE1463167.1 hypothetical protein [Spartinivicinus sp. A2-2]
MFRVAVALKQLHPHPSPLPEGEGAKNAFCDNLIEKKKLTEADTPVNKLSE